MKKKNIAVAAAAVSVFAASAVLAEPLTKTIDAVYNNIKIVINGTETVPKDANGNSVNPFISEGTTYLPVRAVAEALGQKVNWDEKTNTVSITSDANKEKNKEFEKGELIYENPLSSEKDTENWIMEGLAKVTFPEGRLRMESILDASEGQAANFVYWCPHKQPDNIIIEWDFTPLSDEGLAIMFFGANGQNGKDLFDESLSERTGQYRQYHSSDINAFHASYYRRSETSEREFNVANLRKSAGFHIVSQGADPIPTAEYRSEESYHMRIVKATDTVIFSVNDLEVFRFDDDGKTYGDYIKDGYIGFRQKAPLTAEYSNLKIYTIK
ncbi:MAG: DUF1961 family protein [bacterium]|nr:DUF1961 family protein [bacterium]